MLRRVGSVGVLLAVLLIAPVGAPVQLSYVYSDSMEPTIDVDDGYVLVPAGDIEEGDVITFWSDERDGYVTHRVVGETDDGYLTKGDNNPTTDQAAGYEPVSPDQVRGSVLSFNGEPLLIPGLGVLIVTLQSNMVPLLLLGLGAIAAGLLRGGTGRPTRSVPRTDDIVRPVFLVGFAVTVGVLAFGGGSYDISLVAVDSAGAATGPSTMLVGATKPVETVISQPATLFSTRVVGGRGVDVESVSRTATNVTVSGTVQPPQNIGPVPARITVHQYPSVLPRATLEWLHGLHPLAAASTTSTIVFAPFWLAYRVSVDGAEPIRRSRSRLWVILTEGFE